MLLLFSLLKTYLYIRRQIFRKPRCLSLQLINWRLFYQSTLNRYTNFYTVSEEKMNKKNKDRRVRWLTVLGGISIPSVGLNLAIGKGTSPYTLALTAGTMKEDQEMGKENYALAGHYMKDPDLLFRPLYEVEIGDTVYLTDLSYIYEYQVIEQRKIEATEVSVIDDVPNKTLLTLITCDDDGVTRLWTSAEFVQKVSVDDASPEMLEAFDSDLSIRSR